MSILLSSLVWMICQPLLSAQTVKEPLSKNDVIKLLKGRVSPERVEELAKQRGIDFKVTQETEIEVRSAGASDSLLAVLRQLAAKATPLTEANAILLIHSNPGGALVYIDDTPIGTTSVEGRLRVPTLSPGLHQVRLSLEGYMDLEQAIVMTADSRMNHPPH